MGGGIRKVGNGGKVRYHNIIDIGTNPKTSSRLIGETKRRFFLSITLHSFKHDIHPFIVVRNEEADNLAAG
jgi:hypothetical protein